MVAVVAVMLCGGGFQAADGDTSVVERHLQMTVLNKSCSKCPQWTIFAMHVLELY